MASTLAATGPPPLLFEALPPELGATHSQWQDHLEALDPLRGAGLQAVNVPEIVGGAYTTVEPRAFAASLQRRLGLRAIVNRITVHHTQEALESWAAETRLGYGIRDIVLVGGEKASAAYPGIGVTQALAALRAGADRTGGRLGVVTIPTRRRAQLDEPERLLVKRRSGADFAISQILCEAGAGTRLQHDLAALLEPPQGRERGGELVPPRIFWSLAPVAKRRDLQFLRWLGVDVPLDHEADLMETPAPSRVARSHERNEAIARRLLEAAEQVPTAPIGFCVEHVMLHNVEAAIELVGRLRDVCKEFAGLRAVAAAPVAQAATW